MNNIIFQKRNRDVIFDCIVQSNPDPIIEWQYQNGDRILESDKYDFAEFRHGEFFYYRLYIKVFNTKKTFFKTNSSFCFISL